MLYSNFCFLVGWPRHEECISGEVEKRMKLLWKFIKKRRRFHISLLLFIRNHGKYFHESCCGLRTTISLCRCRPKCSCVCILVFPKYPAYYPDYSVCLHMCWPSYTASLANCTLFQYWQEVQNYMKHLHIFSTSLLFSFIPFLICAAKMFVWLRTKYCMF
jgi:hypothetical protein